MEELDILEEGVTYLPPAAPTKEPRGWRRFFRPKGAK